MFVCHANLCRSPLAERLARQALDDAFGAAGARVVVTSAGTHAYAGSPMHAGSLQALDEWGIDGGDFRSRRVTAPLLEGADLVLAAGREQRAACVTLAPATVRRTFTIRQFTRFAQAATPGDHADPAQRLRALMEQVGAVRHLVPPAPGDADDLPDPVQEPIEAFRACAVELRDSIRLIATS